MAYARMGASCDVYIYMAAGYNKLICMGCRVLSIDAPLEMDGASFIANSTQEMIDHIAEHRKIGDLVPDGIEEDLIKDDSQNYPI